MIFAPKNWYFQLFLFLCVIVGMVTDNVLGTTFSFTNPATGAPGHMPYGYVYVVITLFLFLPGVSVMVRRLHDTGRSGWWYWIVLVPLIGGILLLVWFCSRGTRGDNA